MRLRHAVLPAVATIAMITALASPAAAARSSAPDRDHDGLPDRWEVANHLNPRQARDARTDGDKDGLSNLKEFQLHGNPRSADTDRDSVDDGLEARLRTKLDATDSDGDGVQDGDDDANQDGICDRDQRVALGVIASFDEVTGDLILTTPSGATRTVTLTDDTEIEQREHRGWAHHPPRQSDDSDDDSDGFTQDPGDLDGEGDTGDGLDDAGDATQDGDTGTDAGDDADDPTEEPVEVVDPDGVELLSTGTVVLVVRLEQDGTVRALKLA